jgi:hypothetical protein
VDRLFAGARYNSRPKRSIKLQYIFNAITVELFCSFHRQALILALFVALARLLSRRLSIFSIYQSVASRSQDRHYSFCQHSHLLSGGETAQVIFQQALQKISDLRQRLRKLEMAEFWLLEGMQAPSSLQETVKRQCMENNLRY